MHHNPHDTCHHANLQANNACPFRFFAGTFPITRAARVIQPLTRTSPPPRTHPIGSAAAGTLSCLRFLKYPVCAPGPLLRLGRAGSVSGQVRRRRTSALGGHRRPSRVVAEPLWHAAGSRYNVRRSRQVFGSRPGPESGSVRSGCVTTLGGVHTVRLRLTALPEMHPCLLWNDILAAATAVLEEDVASRSYPVLLRIDEVPGYGSGEVRLEIVPAGVSRGDVAKVRRTYESHRLVELAAIAVAGLALFCAGGHQIRARTTRRELR
jgi:hypothetical protein